MAIEGSGGPAERGFAEHPLAGFVGANGSLFSREDEGSIRFGFVVEQRHCNPFDTCHGGWLATLADVQLFYQAHKLTGIERKDLVTVSLSLDYLGAAKLGEWVEGEARLVRRTRSLVFMDGLARTDARPVIRANGTFHILSER